MDLYPQTTIAVVFLNNDAQTSRKSPTAPNLFYYFVSIIICGENPYRHDLALKRYRKKNEPNGNMN